MSKTESLKKEVKDSKDVVEGVEKKVVKENGTAEKAEKKKPYVK